MKKSLMASLVGVISLAVLIPLSSVLAQSQPLNPSSTQSGYHRGHRGYGNLTAEQKTQLKQLSENTRKQINGVLTQAQLSQYLTAISQGKSTKDAMAGINLSADQKAQIQQIRQNAWTQMQAIAPELGKHKGKFQNLTDAQKTQMQALRQSVKQQVEAVLTSEQQSQLQAAISQGQKPREAMATLNLSSSQQAQIQQIRQTAKTQIQAILKTS